MSRHPITCHILDTTRGQPARGISCSLFVEESEESTLVGKANTDGDGRIARWTLASNEQDWTNLIPGIYRIRFHTSPYFTAKSQESGGSPQMAQTFFPYVDVTFQVQNPPDKHYHIPLLLSNHSYCTYRGS